VDHAITPIAVSAPHALHLHPNTISSGLLALIFSVMPGHARADLFKINVLAVEQHLAQYPLITVQIMVFDRNDLTGDQVGYQIGLQLLAAAARFNELGFSNKRRKEWRQTCFGDDLPQRRANDWMHVAELFAATRPNYIPITGQVHLARPCNREIYETAVAKLNPNEYQPANIDQAATPQRNKQAPSQSKLLKHRKYGA
jgi:hypothetical protein